MISDGVPLIDENSLRTATKLTITTASVSQKIVHSPSCCASAAAGIWSGVSVMKSCADSARNTSTPISQATTPRVVADREQGSSGQATTMTARPANTLGRQSIARHTEPIRLSPLVQRHQQPGHQLASIRQAIDPDVLVQRMSPCPSH